MIESEKWIFFTNILDRFGEFEQSLRPRMFRAIQHP
jgi:hypothetical protein